MHLCVVYFEPDFVPEGMHSNTSTSYVHVPAAMKTQHYLSKCLQLNKVNQYLFAHSN